MSDSSESPVLVTGGTGFVGSHLVERLVASGVRPRCLVRRSSSLRHLPREGIELVYGELATGEGLDEAVEGMEVVYHVAGITKALSEAIYYDGNLRGTQRLLHACERHSAGLRRFVHVSSLAAIGPSPDGTPLGEGARPRPLTWYGKSKLAAEEAVRASAISDQAVIVRPPVVYGPRDTDVFEVFRSVANGLMVRIGRGDSYFSYTHAGDLAEVLLAAGRCAGAAGRIYFAANPEPISWTEFARTAAAIMGRPVRFISLPRSVAHVAGWLAELASRLRGKPGIISRQKVLEAAQRYWVCDASRSRDELGFPAPRTLEQGIAETLSWYKDAKWLKW